MTLQARWLQARALACSAVLLARAAAALAMLGAPLAGAQQTTPLAQQPLKVSILAINDFHGHLLPSVAGLPRPRQPATPSGGVAVLATALAEERARNPHHAFVSAGDLVGGTPLLSALLHDEPTIELLSELGLEAVAMGNHELDRGVAELQRLQGGGCHPQRGCQGPQRFAGARFRYLAANTLLHDSGKTLFAPYWIKHFEGVPVAFVGATMKDTPRNLPAAATKGLRFVDVADSVNALVPELQRQGVQSIVVLLHEGGFGGGDINECPALNGSVVEVVKRLHPAVDVVLSAHTHAAYVCRVEGRLVASGHRYGTLLTRVELTLDRRSGDVVNAEAENLVMSATRYPPNAEIARRVAEFERIAEPLAKRRVGRVAAPLLTRINPHGESDVGRLVADAQLAATRDVGAQIAFMNLGGLRAQLGREGRLEVTYEDLHAVQPFGNHLVTLTLSGAQILRLLEQQPMAAERSRLLQVSAGFAYRWDARQPAGQRVVSGSVTLDGRPLDPAADYRVTVNNFIAEGGDGFSLLREGRAVQAGMLDIEALEAFVSRQADVRADATPRVTRVDLN